MAEARQPSILVVDDHPLWRQTLCRLIEHADAAKVVYEAGDGDEAIAVAAKRDPDVVIMDMAMPRVHGVDAIAAIVGALPGTRVLVLSSSDDDEQVVAAVRAGATGYLLKNAGAGEIVDAIRRVHAGELVFPPSLVSIVLEELRGTRTGSRTRSPLDDLTDRELDVLALMAEGRTNAEIGKQIHVSSRTVEAHVTSIFTKLGLDPSAGGDRRVMAVVAYLQAKQ